MSTKTKKGTRRRKVKAKVPRLTEEELNEEFDIILSTKNPYMSEKCVEFDRKSQTFKPTLDYGKPVLVLKYQGVLRKKKSEGAEFLFGERGEKQEEEKMRNKFNFRHVATQTPQTHSSEHGNQTDPSLFPVLKFKGLASKAEILAAYEGHQKKKRERDQYSWIKDALRDIRKYVGKKATPFEDSNIKYLRLCERTVDQNLSEANLDYSYYDNPNDEFSPNFGSLLPLWHFKCSLTKNLPVTDIVWSNYFSDLFAVSYRSLKEDDPDEDELGMIREGGVLCVYSLKGPNYPEKILQSSAGVSCLSFHPVFSHFLAAGCEGGIINVYDLRRDLNNPAGANKTTESIIHHDTVKKLEWFPDTLPQKLCTISSDGKVLIWQFWLNDLALSDDVISLNMKECHTTSIATEEATIKMAGTSVDLNPEVKDLFLVGTETGAIYKCSFDDKKQVDSYVEHKRSVLRVQWNPYHPKVFLSCSDDMTIRIWDHTARESVFEFFFENEVKDACWAPFSSTLFAVVTGTAKVYVYDLSVDKMEALGNYTVYTAKEGIDLTTVSFHPIKPVLMVGDERGHVASFKLSPNLRSSLQALETMEKSKFVEAEIAKMEKLFHLK